MFDLFIYFSFLSLSHTHTFSARCLYANNNSNGSISSVARITNTERVHTQYKDIVLRSARDFIVLHFALIAFLNFIWFFSLRVCVFFCYGCWCFQITLAESEREKNIRVYDIAVILLLFLIILTFLIFFLWIFFSIMQFFDLNLWTLWLGLVCMGQEWFKVIYHCTLFHSHSIRAT